MDYYEILSYQLCGKSIQEYLYALGLLLGLILAFRLFRYVILSRLEILASKTATKFDDCLIAAFRKIHPRFYDLIALCVVGKTLDFPIVADKLLNGIVLAIIIYQIIVFIQVLLNYFLSKLVTVEQEDSADATVLQAMNMLAKIALWAGGTLFFLSNLGVNVNSLAASLGIGGIAVALAVQNILNDIFSSFSIYFDKPFVVGDTITVGTDTGTVKKIGLKTTRLESLQGEELIISNKELTSARIQNFKKMEKRRVLFSIAVTYDTTLEQCKSIPELVAKVFQEVDGADLDRVTFKEFGDFSLNYEIVYYHLSNDYKECMLQRQDVNLKIKEEFEKAGIEFAFPTQTLFVNK